MADDQMPLYLGIPLAILLVALTVFLIMFAVIAWKGRDDE